MDDIKFRKLDLSLIDKLVLFQKNFFDELNGNVFSKKELIRNLNSKYNCTYICLDQDALTNAKRIAQTFLREGIKVHLVKLDSEDPNELGYKKITEKIQDTYQFSFEELMQMEIDSLWK